MINPSKFIMDLKPYDPTTQDIWSSVSSKRLLKLDWNEAPEELKWHKDSLEKIITEKGIIAWYPDCLAIELTESLSKKISISPNYILTFPGSDVALETLCKCYFNYDDNVLVLSPTYENFFVYVNSVGAKLDYFLFDDVSTERIDQLKNYISNHHNLKAIYITRPNNPLGYVISYSDIEDLCALFPKVIFIIDEAYIEFANDVSCVNLVNNHNNIVVTRTFSKAYGMAGLRIGYIVGSLHIINTLNKIRNGKNLSMISQRMACFALENYHQVQLWIDQVIEARNYFQNWCDTNNIEYFQSNGNFVTFFVKNPIKLCSDLKAEGILIRNRNKVLSGYVRATMGSKNHIEKLISSLKQTLEID